MKEMEKAEFKDILHELCIGMNLQLKSKDTDKKRGISLVNQISINDKGGATWGGTKHSARLEQKSKNQSEQGMDVTK
jgi:hypothetical protein